MFYTGGFVPKEPSKGSNFYDKWTTTRLDFVTEDPLKNNLSRLSIGMTIPNFYSYIH